VLDQAGEALEVVLFRAGGVLFAVPADGVEQAQRRDAHLSALDLAAEMGRTARRDLILVLRCEGERARVRVDEVVEVAALPLAAIHPLPRLAAERHRGGYVFAVAERDDELAVMLDVRALIHAQVGEEADAPVAVGGR